MKLSWLSVCFLVMHSSCRQCNATTQQDEKKIRRTSWWMNYYHEKIVILRRQVRPASVVMSSSPFKPPLYPKQVILLAKTDGLSWVGNWIRSKKKSDAFVFLGWPCWLLGTMIDYLSSVSSSCRLELLSSESKGARVLASEEQASDEPIDEWWWIDRRRGRVERTEQNESIL